jgi:methylmalonyl-CoA mutase C-terminal domain/subunit
MLSMRGWLCRKQQCIIHEEDIATLKQAGVREIFTPGATTDQIVGWVRTNVQPRG